MTLWSHHPVAFPDRDLPASPPPAPFVALVRRLVAVDARHREAAALAQLDDRLLRDIGLDRPVGAELKRRRYSAAS